MKTLINKLNKWANSNTNYWLDSLRVLLGMFFVYKGSFFVTNGSDLVDTIAPISNFLGGMPVLHYVTFAHILGGILTVFGLVTRWAIIAQLPILIGAILINFYGEMDKNNLILAIIVLIVSLFYLIYGSGKHSADYFLRMEE